MSTVTLLSSFFFFNDTATTEIYTLSLHDALPISSCRKVPTGYSVFATLSRRMRTASASRSRTHPAGRSEEHTSELQSQSNLVCRLLLEKKKKRRYVSSSSERTSTTYILFTYASII